MWCVDYIEYQRGWGSRLDGTSKFATYEEAKSEQERFNSRNKEAVMPGWYMIASDPYFVPQGR